MYLCFERGGAWTFLKRPFLDPTGLNIFQSVSIFPFLEKVAEVVTIHLQGILEEVDYLDLFQSGCRLDYSIEMALVMLLDDLWKVRNGRQQMYYLLSFARQRKLFMF